MSAEVTATLWPTETLLGGIVGSTAYGLDHPGSDVDRLGMFAQPTIGLLGLGRAETSRVTKNPDVTIHEAAKYCRLALSCNPMVLELLWLPVGLYEVCTDLGADLIQRRTATPSAKRVRDAYLGYASQQFRRLETRGDGSFSADTRKRTAKHARHLYRLCFQGLELYRTGQLPIRLESPERFHAFGELVAEGDIDAARRLIVTYEEGFDRASPAVPSRPNQEVIERWLLEVRREHLPRTWVSSTTR